ncbi:alpha/beta hydrolase family protein [Larkinella bovis]|uniref:Alpha/beta hydrolase family protein n=1 Tax=Larkinella bovis TaxID=683041 RepID=A0ABW0IHD3_9BACT
MRLFLVSIFLFGSLKAFGQYSQRQVGRCTVFTIPFENDSATFAVNVPPAELKAPKAILLFRQGSLPIPLFTKDSKSQVPALTELPGTFSTYKAEYYSIIIAKPGVPLVVDESYLDSLFSSSHSARRNSFSATYFAHNYLDYYVRQTNAVLAFLVQQPWVDAKRVALVGGSEGYHVAIKTAYTNPKVTHLVAFSGSLEGRLQGMIRTERTKGYTGEYTQEEAQRRVEELQKEWVAICADSLNTRSITGDPNRTMYSFSHNQNINYLLALTIPICIVYGAADVHAHSNDILPLEFARRKKTNLTVKVYPGHDHTFHKITYDSAGKAIRKAYNGEQVQHDYLEWLMQH